MSTLRISATTFGKYMVFLCMHLILFHAMKHPRGNSRLRFLETSLMGSEGPSYPDGRREHEMD